MATISIRRRRPRAAPRRRVRTRPPIWRCCRRPIVVLVVYLGCMLWTVRLSFTSSKLLPKLDFVGLEQYQRLFANDRWIVSVENLAIFGVLFIVGCPGPRLPAGGVHRPADPLRGRVPHHLPLSRTRCRFIVTGLVWQWILNPDLGLQKLVRDLGLDELHLRLDRATSRW